MTRTVSPMETAAAYVRKLPTSPVYRWELGQGAFRRHLGRSRPDDGAPHKTCVDNG